MSVDRFPSTRLAGESDPIALPHRPLLCEQISESVSDAGSAALFEAELPQRWHGRDVDPVEIHWHELGRRAFQATTRAGRRVRVLLPRGARVRHGDILVTGTDWVIAVNVPETDVLIVRPHSMTQAALLALELGNLHIPTQIALDELRVPPDGPARQAFDERGARYEGATRRFAPEPVRGAAVRLAAAFQMSGRRPANTGGEASAASGATS